MWLTILCSFINYMVLFIYLVLLKLSIQIYIIAIETDAKKMASVF